MGKVKGRILSFVVKFGSLAVLLATVLAPGCRISWYQPKEPENLSELLKK